MILLQTLLNKNTNNHKIGYSILLQQSVIAYFYITVKFALMLYKGTKIPLKYKEYDKKKTNKFCNKVNNCKKNNLDIK